MRLLVFLHGTTIMHAGDESTLHDYAAYVPVGDAPTKLRRWCEQGAEIAYLSSHRSPDDVAEDRAVLRRFGFPPGPVLARAPGETYGDVAVRAAPDVLIEDDCESIGAAELTYPQIPPAQRARIKSIVVPEFGGMDHLPDDLEALKE